MQRLWKAFWQEVEWRTPRRTLSLWTWRSGSFIDYLSGRQFGIYPSNSPPSYRRKSTSYFDIYTDELNRALAREAVNRFFRPPQQRIQNNFNNIGNVSKANHYLSENADKIFGIRAHACEKCLTTEPLEVYFVDNQKKEVTRRENKHICNPQLVEEAKQLPNKDMYAKEASDKLPQYLKTVIKAWTKNKTNLIAIELSCYPLNNSIKSYKRTIRKIRLQYTTQEKELSN